MPNDDNQLKWDNMLEWRGEVSSTIHHLERSLEKQELTLSKLEDVCRNWSVECSQHKTEIHAVFLATVAEARDNLRAEIETAKSNINNLENFSISAEEQYVTKDDLQEEVKVINKDVGDLRDKIGKIPLKVAAAIISLLAAYEILQRVGLL